MKDKIIYFAIGMFVCLTFSFTLYTGNEVSGEKILNTIEVPLQQKLVKVIESQAQCNQMVKSGFVLQDVDIENGKRYYTLIQY
jgi:hypothetical protein